MHLWTVKYSCTKNKKIKLHHIVVFNRLVGCSSVSSSSSSTSLIPSVYNERICGVVCCDSLLQWENMWCCVLWQFITMTEYVVLCWSNKNTCSLVLCNSVSSNQLACLFDMISNVSSMGTKMTRLLWEFSYWYSTDRHTIWYCVFLSIGRFK